MQRRWRDQGRVPSGDISAYISIQQAPSGCFGRLDVQIRLETVAWAQLADQYRGSIYFRDEITRCEFGTRNPRSREEMWLRRKVQRDRDDPPDGRGTQPPPPLLGQSQLTPVENR